MAYIYVNMGNHRQPDFIIYEVKETYEEIQKDVDKLGDLYATWLRFTVLRKGKEVGKFSFRGDDLKSFSDTLDFY